MRTPEYWYPQELVETKHALAREVNATIYSDDRPNLVGIRAELASAGAAAQRPKKAAAAFATMITAGAR